MESVTVILYGTRIGSVTWDRQRELGIFRYDSQFLTSGIELSPIHLPLSGTSYTFPDLSRESFMGLPGLVADALPDFYGKRVMNLWFAAQGRDLSTINPVERLCFIANRAMGALEFEPGSLPRGPNRSLEVGSLCEAATSILLGDPETLAGDEFTDFVRAYSVSGGFRAKAAVAFSPKTKTFRTSLGILEHGFEPWLIKLDGVESSADTNLRDPPGQSRIELAYHRMACDAGITMSRAELYEYQGRAHFMTRRFDRSPDGKKIHMQTLAALGHFDFTHAGGYSYEQAFQIGRQLGLAYPEIEELFRRAVFNILARNQNDHPKNTSFLMNRRGEWSLAPAYDLTFSHNPNGLVKSEHKMSLNEKRDDFEAADLQASAREAEVKPRRVRTIINEVKEALNQWPKHAYAAGVTQGFSIGIAQQFRQLK